MNKISVRNGLHAGITVVVIGSILHAIDPRSFLNSYGLISYAVFLFFMIRSAVQVREFDEGVLPFSSAFIASFIPMTIGVLFYSFFTYAIHNWINPDLMIIVKEIAIEMATYTYQIMSDKFDIDVDEDQFLKEVEKVDYSFNFGKMFFLWLFTTLMGSIPALIVALVTKRGEG